MLQPAGLVWALALLGDVGGRHTHSVLQFPYLYNGDHASTTSQGRCEDSILDVARGQPGPYEGLPLMLR